MHPIEIITSRRSIRKFKADHIPWDNIVAIIKCAMNSPVAGNIFNTKFIVVQDLGGRKALAEAAYNQTWIAHAPCVICIIAEPEQQKRFYGLRGEMLYTIQNAAACTMSIIIAAEMLGLGSCWVGSFDEDKMRNTLGLPEYANVHALVAIGYPDEKPKSPKKPSIKTVTYLEKWWAARKVPAYGFYSDNVMKTVKTAEDMIKKGIDKISGKDKKPK